MEKTISHERIKWQCMSDCPRTRVVGLRMQRLKYLGTAVSSHETSQWIGYEN